MWKCEFCDGIKYIPLCVIAALTECVGLTDWAQFPLVSWIHESSKTICAYIYLLTTVKGPLMNLFHGGLCTYSKTVIKTTTWSEKKNVYSGVVTYYWVKIKKKSMKWDFKMNS